MTRFPPTALLVLALFAGCSDRDPKVLLPEAIRATAASPHTFSGKTTRSLGPDRLEWQITGSYASPWLVLDQSLKSLRRKAYGSEGWWVEKYGELWRPYPPPDEATEWLDGEAMGAEARAAGEQEVGGVACVRVTSGPRTFDISKKDGRIVRAFGTLTDGTDTYTYEMNYVYDGAVRVEPPREVVVLLQALGGRRPEGDDAAAREAAVKAWEGLATADLAVSITQRHFVGRQERQLQSAYHEQDLPFRAANISVGSNAVFLFSDGKSTRSATAIQGNLQEAEALPPIATEGLTKLISGAVFEGEAPLGGLPCRIVGVRLASSTEEGAGKSSMTAWIWISADGKLQRQVLIGKVGSDDRATEITTCVDMVFTHGTPTGELMTRCRQVFGK